MWTKLISYSPSLAGPCVVAALVATGNRIVGIKDSKKLSRKVRDSLLQDIKRNCTYTVVPATVNDIAQLGLYSARNFAILKAVKKLQEKVEFEKVVLDGYWSRKWLDFFVQALGCPVIGVIDGDNLIYEVMAASVIAKISVDLLFDKYNRKFPGYGLNKNHGFLSVEHLDALRKHGPTEIHRTSYQSKWWATILEKGGENA